MTILVKDVEMLSRNNPNPNSNRKPEKIISQKLNLALKLTLQHRSRAQER